MAGYVFLSSLHVLMLLYNSLFAEILICCRLFVDETAVIKSVKLVAESLAVRLSC